MNEEVTLIVSCTSSPGPASSASARSFWATGEVAHDGPMADTLRSSERCWRIWALVAFRLGYKTPLCGALNQDTEGTIDMT